VFDERDAWSEHRPSAQRENGFIDRHGFEEYAKWYLSINDEKDERINGRHDFRMEISIMSLGVGCLLPKAERVNTSISISKKPLPTYMG
jgi:hypothetical protein